MKSVTFALILFLYVSVCVSGYDDNVSLNVSEGGERARVQIDHLSAEWLEPPTRRVLWQIGRLDGQPEGAESPFTGEFGKKTIPGEVIRIVAGRVHEDFPQRIQPGQTIVVVLPEMVPQDLLFRAVSVRWDEPNATLDPTKDAPSLRILCNENPIWGRRLPRQRFMINALIPASYLKSHNNTISLQNTGKVDVVFDALWIESALGASETVQFAIRDWERIPDDYKADFAWNQERETKQQVSRLSANHDPFLQYPMQQFEAAIKRQEKIPPALRGLWWYLSHSRGFNEQENLAALFLERAVGWFFHGGSHLVILNMTGPGHFFCEYTSRKYPSAYALSAVSRVFEGEARRLPLNVLPVRENQQLLNLVYWMATENKPGIASIIITRSRFGHIPGNRVRIVCALPWKGATVANIENGIFPEDVFMQIPTNRGGQRDITHPRPYDRDRRDKVVNVQIAPNGQGGLLDIELDIRDGLFIRLVQEGVEPMGSPPQREITESPQAEDPPFLQVAIAVSDSHESSLRVLKQLPVFPGVLSHLSPNYRIRSGEATRGAIAGTEDNVPGKDQSLFVDVDYSFGTPLTAEGAALSLHPFRENIAGKVMSFWVYPHAKTGGDPVPLRIGLGAWEGRVMLEPMKWQRVELDFSNTTTHLRGGLLVLLAPAADDWARRIDDITFELNGIRLLNAPTGK